MAAFQFPDPAVQTTVVNPITGSTYQWKEPPGKWVVTVSMRDVGDIIWEGDKKPDPVGDYKLWYHTEELELYFYYCDENSRCDWIPTSKPITMLEDLDNTVFELRRDLSATNVAVRENENQIGRTIYFSDTAPTIYDDVVYDDVAFPNELNYKFWYDTARLELLILFRDEDGDDSYVPVSIPLESLPEPGVSTETFTYTTGRLQTAIEENYLHNLNQDTSIDGIKNDIIELEEEIDAIAPSVERGRWTFTAVGTVAQPGQFTMYDADFGNGQPTGLFKSAKSIWFNELDIDGTPHAFGDVDDGELLEIFVEGSSEYGLYEVVGEAHDETQTGTKFWVIDVNFVRTLETTTAVGPGELCRFKIFMAPTGGDASSFVMNTGDTMTGNLVIDKSEASTNIEAGLELKGSRGNTTNSAATITFQNDQSLDLGYLTYRSYDNSSYFRFNQDVDLNNNGLHSVAQIRMQPGGYIGSAANPRLTFNNANGSSDGSALLVVPRPADNRRSFAIRGNDAEGIEQDMLYTYINAFGTPDAVNYLGKMDSDKNLVNKEYVDTVASPTVSLTSGGNARWNSGNLPDSSLEGYRYFSIKQAGSTSSSISLGNVLYLNKLIDSEGVLQRLDKYTPTDHSYFEVYLGTELAFKAQLKPSTYKVASRNPDEIVCDFSYRYPLVSKGGTNWSTSSYYSLSLTGMKYTGISRGNDVLKYTFQNSVGDAVSSPGKIGTNSGFWSSVNQFSFSTADINGTATPSISNDDIIETYNAKENKINRYTVTNASGAPNVVQVQYVSGDYFYTIGDELEVNIY